LARPDREIHALRLRSKLLIALLVVILLSPWVLIYGLYYRGLGKLPDFPDPPAASASEALTTSLWGEFEGEAPIEVERLGPVGFFVSVMTPLLSGTKDDEEVRQIPAGFRLAEWCAGRLLRQQNPQLLHQLEYGLASLAVAIRLSSRWSTAQIVACALETSYFGRGFNGVTPAARSYFDKTPSELSHAEAATLVVLIRRPAVHDPICRPKRAIKARNALLEKMAAGGLITAEEAAAAAQRPLAIKLTETCD
jgi:hypothetical protein